jgi:glycosyltransferase involved in cell wall biosynthesis
MRARRLARLLDDLVNQITAFRYEIIVVDNGSTDETSAVVQRLVVRRAVALNAQVRYFYEPRLGASRARNRGIASARAPILAFVDDDVRVASDWVESIVRAFEHDPTVDCLGGQVEPRWPTEPPRWLTKAHWPPLALQIGRGTAPYLDAEHASACLITANFACRADVFQELGGFSPEFVRDEDREFNLRMWRAGKRGKYEPSIRAFAEVQHERLARRHHRQWYRVTGRSHARLRYLEIVDRDGRLHALDESRGRYLFGAPLYLYRELVTHGAQWIKYEALWSTDDAFFEECRVRYLLAYLATRWTDYARKTRAQAASFLFLHSDADGPVAR